MTHMNLQPVLENGNVLLQPLKPSDFEKLYEVARDPEVWSMHPNKDRYKREVFQNFFKGALESGGAFLIINKCDNAVIGSTRFYDYDAGSKSILIGYTFYGKAYWGRGFNAQVKKLMLDYIFRFVDTVDFHVGRDNLRSVRAMEKLGAESISEQEIAYYGESPKINIIFQITKEQWANRH